MPNGPNGEDNRPRHLGHETGFHWNWLCLRRKSNKTKRCLLYQTDKLPDHVQGARRTYAAMVMPAFCIAALI